MAMDRGQEGHWDPIAWKNGRSRKRAHTSFKGPGGGQLKCGLHRYVPAPIPGICKYEPLQGKKTGLVDMIKGLEVAAAPE